MRFTSQTAKITMLIPKGIESKEGTMIFEITFAEGTLTQCRNILIKAENRKAAIDRFHALYPHIKRIIRVGKRY